MGDFARHQELQRVLGAGIVAEIDQPLVDDLGARLGGDVAAQIDVELAGDFKIVGGPALPTELLSSRLPAADSDQGIGLGGFAILLHRLEVHARERADDFQMAQLFGADVHQEILAIGIVAIQTLDRILHRSREFAFGAAELLKQHISEAGIWRSD